MANVQVARLESESGSGIIKGFSASIRIECVECKLPFEFIGLEGGISPFAPRVSIDGTELRAPIAPSSGKLIFEGGAHQN